MATPIHGGQDRLEQQREAGILKLDEFLKNKNKSNETKKDESETVLDDESGDTEVTKGEDADKTEEAEETEEAEVTEPKEEAKEADEEVEEDEESEEELALSIEKIRREADSAISKKHDKWFESSKKLVEINPEYLLTLASSSDDTEVKLAKRISNDLGYGSLGKAISEIKEASEAVDSELGQSDKEKEPVSEALIEKRVQNRMKKESFEKSNPILDKSSDKYNENVHNKFNRLLNSLVTIDEYTTESEIQEALDDALYTSSRGVNEKNYRDKALKDAAIIAAQKKQVSKGNAGAKGKSQKKEEPKSAKDKFIEFGKKVKAEKGIK